MSKLRFVSLDVHAGTIAVAVAETGDEVHSLGLISKSPESVRKLVHKLGPVQPAMKPVQRTTCCIGS